MPSLTRALIVPFMEVFKYKSSMHFTTLAWKINGAWNEYVTDTLRKNLGFEPSTLEEFDAVAGKLL